MGMESFRKERNGKDQLTPKCKCCIIVFDELVNYPGYDGETGELRALYEFIEENNVKYEWIGMNGKIEMFNPAYENEQVAIRILEIN